MKEVNRIFGDPETKPNGKNWPPVIIGVSFDNLNRCCSSGYFVLTENGAA